MIWVSIQEVFNNGFHSMAKQTEISNRLETLRLDDEIEIGDDYYTEQNRLTERVNLLTPIARAKRSLWWGKSWISDESGEWYVMDIDRTSEDIAAVTYRRLINSLYTSMRDLNTFNTARVEQVSRAANGFHKALWKPKNTSCSRHGEAIVTEFTETFFVGQKRWGRDSRNTQRGKGALLTYSQPPRYEQELTFKATKTSLARASTTKDATSH